jgi:hypothetical protein
MNKISTFEGCEADVAALGSVYPMKEQIGPDFLLL